VVWRLAAVTVFTTVKANQFYLSCPHANQVIDFH